MLRFGVDEAGKGPVLGSMFAAAVCVGDLSRLPEGIDDSKRLTPSRREELAAILREDDRISIGIAEITTATIDDPETNMNTLAVTAHATAIRDALEGVERDLESGEGPLEGVCDACDTDADRFARRVTEACDVETALGFDVDYRIDASHGADDEYPIVGAASIVAKVERDAHVAAISESYGDVGSGYPSDPKTRAFLERYVDEHGDLPPFARASWSTCADVLAASEQTGLSEF